MNALPRQKTFLLIILLFLVSACQPEELPQGPLESGGGGSAAGGVKITDVNEFQVRAAGEFGVLLPFEYGSRKGFLSDYPIDLNTLISTRITLELVTTTGVLYRLTSIPDLDALVHELDLKARVGEFEESQAYNTAECQLPLDIQSGEELYCGFQFEHKEQPYIVLVFATTKRDLEKSDAEPTRIPRLLWEGPLANVTPTSCTGWDCQIEGVVLAASAEGDIPLAGGSVALRHISNCSPSPDEQQTLTDPKGMFSFDVYIHDTDSFVLTVEAAGYEPQEIKFGGFDCLYCHCPEIKLVLTPLE